MGGSIHSLLLAALMDTTVAGHSAAARERPLAAAAVDSVRFAATVVPTGTESAPSGPTVRAVRVSTPVSVDGALDEAVWQDGDPFTSLIQRDPVEGSPPSQRTEVRVAYDDDAIYVG